MIQPSGSRVPSVDPCVQQCAVDIPSLPLPHLPFLLPFLINLTCLLHYFILLFIFFMFSYHLLQSHLHFYVFIFSFICTMFYYTHLTYSLLHPVSRAASLIPPIWNFSLHLAFLHCLSSQTIFLEPSAIEDTRLTLLHLHSDHLQHRVPEHLTSNGIVLHLCQQCSMTTP